MHVHIFLLTRKTTLPNARDLFNRTVDMSHVSTDQERERRRSPAALLMKKINVIIKVESP